MQVVFHPEAWQEYHDILAYYDAHSLWQAERFAAELDTLIAGIEQQPLRWPPHLKDIRRAQFDRFRTIFTIDCTMTRSTLKRLCISAVIPITG